MDKTLIGHKIVALKDGQLAQLRPILPADRVLLETAWHKLSHDTIRKRFLAPKKGFTTHELDQLTNIDQVDHCAFGMTVEKNGVPEGIGVARFVRDPHEKDLAEFAIVIVDEYQGKGVGTLLMAELIHEARAKGIHRLTGKMDAQNVAMKKLLHKWPYFSFVQDSPGLIQVTGLLR